MKSTLNPYMEHKKDYSLLRPFDLEAANFGTKAYWFETECVWFGPSGNKFSQPMYAVEHNAGMSYVSASELRAYPLAWVEGRPVYKGDVLYCTATQQEEIIDSFFDKYGMLNQPSFVFRKNKVVEYVKHFTWQKQKTKRDGWVNIYKDSTEAYIHQDRKSADENSDECRVACLRIEWEE